MKSCRDLILPVLSGFFSDAAETCHVGITGFHSLIQILGGGIPATMCLPCSKHRAKHLLSTYNVVGPVLGPMETGKGFVLKEFMTDHNL